MIKILIIDDNPDNLVSMSALLKNLISDCSIIIANSGQNGIEKAKEDQPDTILLDVIMPEMDGYEVCKRLKKDEMTKHIPIIMISAIKKDSQSLINGLEAGADNFLQKPIDAGELKAQINVMLRIKKAEDIIREKKKNLENSVQEGKEKFSSLIDTTSNAIIISNQSGNITLWNNGAEKTFGYNASEIIGKPILKIIPESYRSKHEEALEQFVITGRGRHKGETIELEGLRKDRRTFPLELSLSNWQTKGKKYFAAIIRDISERKKTMDALNKANTIINRSPAVAFLWKNSENWPVEFVSQNVKEVLGYSSEDFITGKISYIDIIHPEDRERVSEEVILNSRDKNTNDFIHEPYRIITGKGKIKWIDDRTNILRDENGNITHYQGIILNITKNIQTEKTLKDAQSILVQQEKMASLGGLAAGIAHEINNPLGFVMSNFRTLRHYAETIRDYLKFTGDTATGPNSKEDISKNKKKVDFIMNDMEDLFKESEEGFERISLIVENMRQFSRVDNENNKINVNLNNSIKNTLVIAKNSYKYVAEVLTQFSELPDISCNGSEINQVLLNIIVNAAQAIEQRKDRIKGIIKISTYVEEDKVCCIIEDNGSGIPEKYLNKVFDPFFTTKEVGKGTGMGLSISYDIIVNKHKGELSVKSNMKTGTIFTIKLPINLNEESVED